MTVKPLTGLQQIRRYGTIWSKFYPFLLGSFWKEINVDTSFLLPSMMPWLILLSSLPKTYMHVFLSFSEVDTSENVLRKLTKVIVLSFGQECPKCHVTIEKDGGCNHMVCRNQNCKAEFCWVCLGPWEPHGSAW